jgi:hypothetical protein
VKLKTSKNADMAVSVINAVILVRRMVELLFWLAAWYYGKKRFAEQAFSAI